MTKLRCSNIGGNDVVISIIKAIQSNKDYLSELDGAVGDGDHGINMNKGASIALPLVQEAKNMGDAFGILSSVLMDKIGGSMGPLYGSIFMGMQEALEDKESIDGDVIKDMLTEAYDNVTMITTAKVGDKSLIDVLDPATKQYEQVYESTGNVLDALDACYKASEEGMKSTIALRARIGRASRLGEKSIGHQDAGATSCCIILQAFCKAMKQKLHEEV